MLFRSGDTDGSKLTSVVDTVTETDGSTFAGIVLCRMYGLVCRSMTALDRGDTYRIAVEADFTSARVTSFP